MQQSVIRDAESARLLKRQAGVNPNLVRCWLYTIADYKFVTALQATGDDPLGVMSTIILTVRVCDLGGCVDCEGVVGEGV